MQVVKSDSGDFFGLGLGLGFDCMTLFAVFACSPSIIVVSPQTKPVLTL